MIGVTGRDTTGENKLKWLHNGPTSKWAYPLQINFNILSSSNELILVESIGDMLSLWEAGIKNTMVTFGLRISPHLLTCILRLDPESIIIAFNNDEDGRAGNKAAFIAKKLVQKHFDEGVVKVKLPCKNDFGCMDKKEILEWQKS